MANDLAEIRRRFGARNNQPIPVRRGAVQRVQHIDMTDYANGGGNDWAPTPIRLRTEYVQYEEPSKVEAFFDSKPVRYTAIAGGAAFAVVLVVGIIKGVVSGFTGDDSSQKAA